MISTNLANNVNYLRVVSTLQYLRHFQLITDEEYTRGLEYFRKKIGADLNCYLYDNSK